MTWQDQKLAFTIYRQNCVLNRGYKAQYLGLCQPFLQFLLFFLYLKYAISAGLTHKSRTSHFFRLIPYFPCAFSIPVFQSQPKYKDKSK